MDPLWSYDASSPKPHVHPLVAPNGRVLTRAVTPDHPWQRGVWFAIKFVNGENFWEELEPCGQQRQVDAGTVEWVGPNGEVVLVEDRRIEAVDDHSLDWTTSLTPSVDVALDRTPYRGWGGYGGLALRGAPDWIDTRLAVDGSVGAEVTGRRSPWCDLSGPDAGVTILDHPGNPRHPTPWYANVANPLYLTDEPTNFVNAAFLFHEPMDVRAGDPLVFRYRLRVHDGTGGWTPTSADEAWDEFAHA